MTEPQERRERTALTRATRRLESALENMASFTNAEIYGVTLAKGDFYVVLVPRDGSIAADGRGPRKSADTILDPRLTDSYPDVDDAWDRLFLADGAEENLTSLEEVAQVKGSILGDAISAPTAGGTK